MKQKNYLLLILFFTFPIVLGQNVVSKELQGKVVSTARDLEGIYVINLQTDKAVSTENNGFFEISVSVGDTLMFSAVQIKSDKIVITEKEFEKELFFVSLEPMVNKLDELIIVNYNNINAYSMGILQKPAKKYTPAERRLKSASGRDLEGNTDGTAGVSAGLDPLFSWMSGRTAMLRKELLIEAKELFIKQIENWFSKSYFISKLKISEENVKGFLYFAVDNLELQSVLKSKDRVKTEFIFAKLATEYLELQKEK